MIARYWSAVGERQDARSSSHIFNNSRSSSTSRSILSHLFSKVPVITIEVESPKGSSVRLTDDVVVPAMSSVEGQIRDKPPTNQMARQALTMIALCISFPDSFTPLRALP